MAQPDAIWYVRLPDGKVLRAESSEAVRHHLGTGRVPPDSRVRRSADEPWSAPEAFEEFADLITPPSRRPAPRRRETTPQPNDLPRKEAPAAASLELRAVGLRATLGELLPALESTFAGAKVKVALLAGSGAAAALVAVALFRPGADVWPPLPWLLVGAVALALHALAAAVIAQSTFVELSSLRRARPEEARANLGRNALRLLVAELLVAGPLIGLLYLLAWAGGALAFDGVVGDILSGALAVVRVLVGTLLGLLVPLLPLLAPVVVVEESSGVAAARQWLRLLRGHFGKLFVTQSAALVLGLLMSLPFVIPAHMAGEALVGAPGQFAGAAAATLLIGAGLAPLLAYVSTASVFVYLHVRYELSASLR